MTVAEKTRLSSARRADRIEGKEALLRTWENASPESDTEYQKELHGRILKERGKPEISQALKNNALQARNKAALSHLQP